MSRQARKDLISNYVHIMAQGINREYIFEKDYFKEKYWRLLNEKKENYDLEIISHCIMDNHIHLVMHYETIEDLSEFMKRTNTAYAKWYNKQQERVGYVFRDRYKVEQILDYQHLYSCIRYVHNNPVKAGIVNKPKEYNYSSFKNYLSDKFISNSKILKLLNLSLSDMKEVIIKSQNLNLEKYRGESPEKIIEYYLKDNNIENVKEIKKNPNELIKLLKENTNIGYEEIAKILNISRTTLYRQRKKLC